MKCHRADRQDNRDRSAKSRWLLISIAFSIASSHLVVSSNFSLAAAPTTDDQALRIELAKDGLTTLLDRAYVVDHVPPANRAAEQAVIALRQLNDPTLTATDRSSRLKQVVEGIGISLNSVNDPQVLLTAAAALVKNGVEQDANVLEYFGEDSADATKARLQPVASTAVALYDRAVTLLDRTQSALQDKITRPDDPISAQWQKAYQDFQTAAYTRWMLSCSLALSMDRADKNRALVCDDAIKHLAEWDTPDSGVQAIVRLQIGKLNMLKGKHDDLKQAKENFATLALPPAGGGVSPAPDRFTQFFGKYFSAVCDIIGKDIPAADRDAQIAENFRVQQLPGVLGDDYAMDMLHYRIALLKQDDAEAVRILESLSDKAPGLRPMIAGQLLDKLPDHPDVTRLSPLMLSALISRAAAQVNQPNPDRAVLDEGFAAAEQYLSRADQADPQTTPQTARQASLIRGDILRLESRPAQAAAAYLDHAVRYKNDPDPSAKASAALDAAINQIALLYHGDSAAAHQSDAAALEEKLLPVAVEFFRRYDLAYDYARSLQRSGQPARAAAMFDLVPDGDPNKFTSLFFKMVALNQRLQADAHDAANAVPARDLPGILAQLQQLADQVNAEAARRQAAASDAARKHEYQSMRVRTLLLAADVAGREGHDPKRTITLLSDFERTIKGLPDAKALLGEALNLRVAAYMASGDATKATQNLLEYLNTVGGNEGLQIVYNLLTKLNADLDRAQLSHDAAQVRQLADDRAALTPFLVKWAQANSNRDITKYTYRYRVFDAATQKQAAELEPTPATRSQKLQDALTRFKDLQSPENIAFYQASLPADAVAEVRNYPDPTVTLGIADIAFDLGDWKLVHDSIGQLLADSKLGDGTTLTKNAAGQEEITDNEQFWDAQYKFIHATNELAKDPASGVDPQTPGIILGRLQATWQNAIGGEKWHGKFEELAREIKIAGKTQPPDAK